LYSRPRAIAGTFFQESPHGRECLARLDCDVSLSLTGKCSATGPAATRAAVHESLQRTLEALSDRQRHAVPTARRKDTCSVPTQAPSPICDIVMALSLKICRQRAQVLRRRIRILLASSVNPELGVNPKVTTTGHDHPGSLVYRTLSLFPDADMVQCIIPTLRRRFSHFEYAVPARKLRQRVEGIVSYASVARRSYGRCMSKAQLAPTRVSTQYEPQHRSYCIDGEQNMAEDVSKEAFQRACMYRMHAKATTSSLRVRPRNLCASHQIMSVFY